jgi:hypothetical protein
LRPDGVIALPADRMRVCGEIANCAALDRDNRLA